MDLLKNYLAAHCDKRVPGVFNFAIHEGFRQFNTMTEENKLLQLDEARNAYGMLRHICVDIIVETELERSGIDAKITKKQVSKNGYTYPVIELKGALVTLHKIQKAYYMPKSAWNRKKRSFLNKEISLFDDEINVDYGEDVTPYIMLTYGGLNYSLDFVQLAIPNYGVTEWIDRMDITHELAVIKPYSSGQSKDIELTFNSKVQEYLEKEKRGHERNNKS